MNTVKFPIILSSLLFFTLFFSVYSQNYTIHTVNRSPMYATASILQDYDNDGDLDIIVTRRSGTTDKDPGSVDLLLNDGTGQFPRSRLIENLNVPIDIDKGDFNNDGKIDYFISDNYKNSSLGLVHVAIKGDDGNFTLSLLDDSISTDQSAVADLDKDGNVDIVTVGFNRPTVDIYWNNGNANFTKMAVTDTVIQVTLVELDDIDNDGDVDILYGGGGADGFKLLFNDGNGNFDSTQTLFITNNNYSNAERGMTIADLNNDGVKDILAFSGVGFGGMYFLDGANGFSSSIIDIDGIDLGGDIVSVDIDDNGFNDIIRQNVGDDYLSIIYQNSRMDFSAEFLELNWDNKGPGQLSYGDLDSDGDIDLVFPENGNTDGDISWFENIDGKLYRHMLYHEIEAVRIPVVSDLDNDGDLDIIVSAGDDGVKSEEDEITWYENKGLNNFIEHRVDDNISAPGGLQIGDLDGNGFNEIVATSYEDSSLVWYQNMGSNWLKVVIDENLVNPLGCEVSDIDMDGDLDITICAEGDNSLIWYSNDGSANFTRNLIDNSILFPQVVQSADLNNDEKIDLAVVTKDSSNTVTIYLNNGSENFDKTVIGTNQFSTALDIGDWDRDGNPDIIVGYDKGSAAGESNRDISVFINDGNAVFTDSTIVSLQERTNTLKLADVDNDSDLDVVFGAGTAGIFPIKVALNENGFVQDILDITDDPVRTFGIDIADFNNDGIFDIVTSDQVNSKNNLLLLTGDLSTNVEKLISENIPNSAQIYQNYPNPFNPTTTIEYDINKAGNYSLVVYDILGSKIKTLVNDGNGVGKFRINWDGKNDNGENVSTGIYIILLRASEFQLSNKMFLLK